MIFKKEEDVITVKMAAGEAFDLLQELNCTTSKMFGEGDPIPEELQGRPLVELHKYLTELSRGFVLGVEDAPQT